MTRPATALTLTFLFALSTMLFSCGGSADMMKRRTETGPGSGPGHVLVWEGDRADEPMTSAHREAADMFADMWAVGVTPDEVTGDIRANVSPDAPARWAPIDFDGDGSNEWVGIFGAESCTPARVWMLGSAGVEQIDACGIGPCDPCAVVGVDDLTGDGRADVVIQSTHAGAHTDTMLYQVLSAHHGAIRNLVSASPGQQALAEDSAEMTFAMATLRDESGDGVADLVLQGGRVGAVGSGALQRDRIDVWAFDGEALGLKDRRWAPSDLRLFTLYDANDVFDAGDYALASTAYQRVVDDEGLHDPAEHPDVSAAVRGFAVVRLIVLALRADNTSDADAWGAWFVTHAPESRYARAASTLLEAWSATPGDWSSVCAAVSEAAKREKGRWAPLDDMGYANPSLGPDDLCPLSN